MFWGRPKTISAKGGLRPKAIYSITTAFSGDFDINSPSFHWKYFKMFSMNLGAINPKSSKQGYYEYKLPFLFWFSEKRLWP